MSLPHIAPVGALMTMIIIYELSPQSPDRGVKNTGRGEAKRNPCKKEPPTKQSSEGTTEILSPLSGLQYVHASYAGVSLRSTTCLCSIAPIGACNLLVHPLQGYRSAAPPACVLSAPIGASICSYILCRGFATLYHLPVILTPLSGFAITIRINMMPMSMLFPYEL